MLNADSLQVAKRLWVEPSVRASLVSQAQTTTTTNQDATTTDPAAELGSLPVPLGWHLATAEDDPQGFPFYWDRSMWWSLLSKLIGLTLTAVAISFGAPFWFDTLSKLARLRNGGAPPAAADAGRGGDKAVLATALAEAVNRPAATPPPTAPATDPQQPTE
jgi:hypothetical protein